VVYSLSSNSCTRSGNSCAAFPEAEQGLTLPRLSKQALQPQESARRQAHGGCSAGAHSNLRNRTGTQTVRPAFPSPAVSGSATFRENRAVSFWNFSVPFEIHVVLHTASCSKEFCS